MRLQILSDLHLEFHPDHGVEFIKAHLKPEDVDVLIIAGDLAVSNLLVSSLNLISEKYKNSVVLYIPGNHEFYNSSFSGMRFAFSQCRHLKNVKILDNEMIRISGIDFIGSTLWFKKQPDYWMYTRHLNDFRFIGAFEEHVFEENKEAVKFLKWHVHPKSLVITHHLPTPQSTPEVFRNSPLNMFFASNMEKFILKRQPKLWVHGHTHYSMNYLLGKTHIICNPLGYMPEANREFIPNMMVDL